MMVCISIVAVSLYIFFIVYSNRAHEFLILKNLLYDKELTKYNNLAGTFMNFYIIWLHLVALYVYCINKTSRWKGILQLVVLSVLIFGFCLIMEIALDYCFFKPISDILQFVLILVSESVFYGILCVLDSLKNKVNLKIWLK